MKREIQFNTTGGARGRNTHAAPLRSPGNGSRRTSILELCLVMAGPKPTRGDVVCPPQAGQRSGVSRLWVPKERHKDKKREGWLEIRHIFEPRLIRGPDLSLLTHETRPI